MRIRFNLQTRFLAWFTVLLVFVLGGVLLLVEQREVATIFDDAKAKGLLIARNMAERNVQALFLYQVDAIQRSIETQTDEKLLYVVFYDRYATPIVTNEIISGRSDIIGQSRLQGDDRPDASFTAVKDVWLAARVRRVLEVEVPITIDSPPSKWGTVKVGLSLDDMRQAIQRTNLALVAIGIVGFLIGVAGAVLLSRRIVGPLKTLSEGTVRIARGDFAQPIAIRTGDEIGDLARSFQEMSAKLREARERMAEAQRKLVHSEKLASIGRLSATIAHEIRNPLTSVKLNIQKVAQENGLAPAEREHVAIAQEGISLIEKFVKELLSFTRQVELRKARFDVRQIVEESLKMIRDAFPGAKAQLDVRYAEGLPEILVDGDKMRQVVVNVLRNAYEAMGEEGGRISIGVSAVDDEAGPKVRIRISDNGPGIADKDRENIFEPFFTTKASGVGLGLANARKLIELHNGTIRVVPKRGPGTAFEILIPREEEP